MIELPQEWVQGDRMTSGQVANFFNVSRDTVTRWAKAGIIGFFLTPKGERRFPECEVMRLARAEPVSDETRALCAHFNEVIRERWEDGYRRNDFFTKRAGMIDEETEADDD
jgi:excisionase family DNA binding protein